MKKVMNWIFVVTFIALYSCNSHSGNISESTDLKIAKTVPLVYKNDSDTCLTIHNDTAYLNNQFFSGYRYRLYENGDTSFVFSYFNGVQEGIQRKWFDNGQLEEVRFYINGKKEGEHKGWWPDGKARFQFTAFNDEYEGEFKEWANTRLLIKCFHYKHGNEEGSQRLWWGDGSVKANYVIRDGKKYGFIGYQICQNPYDSVIVGNNTNNGAKN
jgi:hypothetical protein